MRNDRVTAVVVGVLFFAATGSYLAGSELIAAAMNGPDRLSNLNTAQLRWGVFLEFVNAASVVGIGVLLFPILRRHSEGMALGYAGSRLIESALLLVSALGAMMLPVLGREYRPADAANAAQLSTLGTLAIEWYDLAFQLALTVLGAGSLLLCFILYTGALVPRALAVLGGVGYAALFASGWLEMFDQGIGEVLYVPGAFFEIVFPLWLIAKGFNSPAVTAHTESG